MGGHTDTDTHVPMHKPKHFQETRCMPGLKMTLPLIANPSTSNIQMYIKTFYGKTVTV